MSRIVVLLFKGQRVGLWAVACTVWSILASPAALAGDFKAEVANFGTDFVEIRWDGLLDQGDSGGLVDWKLQRGDGDGSWTTVATLLQSNGGHGPWTAVDAGLTPAELNESVWRVAEQRTTGVYLSNVVERATDFFVETNIVTVMETSVCDEPVTVQCPADFQVVGGGIQFGDKLTTCGPNMNLKFKGFSSHPEGNGWYCRGDSRESNCYAVCAHERLGIVSAQRVSESFDKGESWEDVTCPAGTTVVAGGPHLERFWEQASFAEEFKVLGSYKQGNGWRCDAKSPDHSGFCYALCIPDDQLANVELSETLLAPGRTTRCDEGPSRAISGSFSYCSTRDCGEALDEVDSAPRLSRDEMRCLLGFKNGNLPANKTACSAQCLSVDTEPPSLMVLADGVEVDGPVSISSGGNIEFEAIASDPDGLGFPAYAYAGLTMDTSYLWSFDGGETSGPLAFLSPAPIVTFNLDPGEQQRTFRVVVRVYDTFGVASVAEIPVVVSD